MKEEIPQKSLLKTEDNPKFSKMLIYSMGFHILLLTTSLLISQSFNRPQLIPTVYSVDLVELKPGRLATDKMNKDSHPEKSPGTNLGEVPSVRDSDQPQTKPMPESKKVASAPLPKPSAIDVTPAEKKVKPAAIKPAEKNDRKDLSPKTNVQEKPKALVAKKDPLEAAKSMKNHRSQDKEISGSGKVNSSAQSLQQQAGKGLKSSSNVPGTLKTDLAGQPGTGLAGRGLIASDNPSFQNITYLDAIASKMYQNWNFNLWGVNPSQFQNLEVLIHIIIIKDGTIMNPTVEKSSGIPFLDRSALSAVLNSNPLPPLPNDFKENYLRINLKFVPISQEG